jgi:hypothetical protein
MTSQAKASRIATDIDFGLWPLCCTVNVKNMKVKYSDSLHLKIERAI